MKKQTIALLAATTFATALGIYATGDKECKMGKGHEMGKNHPRFKMMDTDKDSKISKDEWMAKFTEMDADKNGSISEEEMKKHHEKMMEMHKDMHDHKHHEMHEKKEKKS